MCYTSQREKKRLEITFPFVIWSSETVSFPLHWHDCFEMLFLTKGGMYLSVDGGFYEAGSGDLIMINSGLLHGFFDPSPGTSIIGMQFDITFFDEGFMYVRDWIFHNPVLGKNILKDSAYTRLQTLLHEIDWEYHAKRIGYQLAVKSKLYELMLVILREISKTNPQTLSPHSKQLFAFVFKHFDDPELTLETAAEALHFNKFYFTRFFKKHTGYSFHSYLTHTRVNFAKRYLIESKMSITDTAFRTGFNSLQTFNRVFKTLTGLSPREYRRGNRPSSMLQSGSEIEKGFPAPWS
jgi:AraC-like DNA-binding protein